MDLRLDRVGLLLDQPESTCEFSRARLEGLTDEEYLWEPVPGAWSIRPRDRAVTDRAYGAGPWVLDEARPRPYRASWSAGRSAALLAVFVPLAVARYRRG